MNRCLVPLLISFLGLIGLTNSSPARTWSDTSGAYSVEATLVGVKEGSVQLLKEDGSIICVPIPRLSRTDREYVRIRLPQLTGETDNQTSRQRVPEDAARGQTQKQVSSRDGWVDIISKVEPSVVRIQTARRSGSGFVVQRANGKVDAVVTNFHVIDGETEATVTFRDKRTAPVLGCLAFNKGRDLALLQIQGGAIRKPLPIADSLPRKGAGVAAFGCPLGFNFTASNGIVSAVRTGEEARSALMEIKGRDAYGFLGYDRDATWIQTTAPISHGNSGGPLVDSQGEVVGVNTWGEFGGQNLNFAIPASEIQKLLKIATDKPVSLASLPKTSYANIARHGGGKFTISLPSGQTIRSATFSLERDALIEWIRTAFKMPPASVLPLTHSNGSIFAISYHRKGDLHGATLAFYEDKVPMVYAQYENGRKDGLLQTWDEQGNKVLWCQYHRNKRNGICCLFENGELRLILECTNDTIDAAHLIAGGTLGRSFASEAKIAEDETSAALLQRYKDLEARITENEREFREMIKEADLAVRRHRVSKLNPQRRAAIQARANQHAAEQDAMIGAVKRLAGL